MSKYNVMMDKEMYLNLINLKLNKKKSFGKIIDEAVKTLKDQQIIDIEDIQKDPKFTRTVYIRVNNETGERIERISLNYRISKASILRRIIAIILEKEKERLNNVQQYTNNL